MPLGDGLEQVGGALAGAERLVDADERRACEQPVVELALVGRVAPTAATNAPGATQSSRSAGSRAVVATTTRSASCTASCALAAARTSLPAASANACRRAASGSKTRTRCTARTVRRAASCAIACGPAPRTPTRLASGRASSACRRGGRAGRRQAGQGVGRGEARDRARAVEDGDRAAARRRGPRPRAARRPPAAPGSRRARPRRRAFRRSPPRRRPAPRVRERGGGCLGPRVGRQGRGRLLVAEQAHPTLVPVGRRAAPSAASRPVLSCDAGEPRRPLRRGQRLA